MKYVIILTFFKLLPSTVVWSQKSREVDLLIRLNAFFCFDHSIFLLDDSVRDLNQHIPVSDMSDGITPQTIFIFHDKNMNIKKGTGRAQLEELANVTSRNAFLIVVAGERFNCTNETSILDQVIAIRPLLNYVKIGVFLEKNIGSMEVVTELFQWSWGHGIVNIFCAFHLNIDGNSSSFNVFRFDPFGETFLLNLTGSDAIQDYFPDKIPNYHLHPLRHWALYGVPVFDFEMKFWRNVVHLFNASMLITFTNETEYAENRFTTVDADVTLFRAVFITEGVMVYPQERQQFWLLVPHSRPYANIIAKLKDSAWEVVIVYTFVVIAATSIVLAISGYLQTNKTNLFIKCVVDVVNLLVNDNTAIRYGQLRRADIFIIVPLTFTGLIVANGILSAFKSYLTVPTYEHQIKTIDDLYKSQLPILSREVLWANATIELLENLSGHSGWREKVHPINYLRHLDELYAFNNSVAYAVFEDYVRWCLSVQKRLNFNAFYLITENNLQQYLATFDVNPNFPFCDTVNGIYHRLQSTGITQKWLQEDDETGIKELTKANLGRQFPSNTVDSDVFGSTTVIWCGWIVGVVVFICELIWNRIQPQIDKLKQSFWRY